MKLDGALKISKEELQLLLKMYKDGEILIHPIENKDIDDDDNKFDCLTYIIDWKRQCSDLLD